VFEVQLVVPGGRGHHAAVRVSVLPLPKSSYLVTQTDMAAPTFQPLPLEEVEQKWLVSTPELPRLSQAPAGGPLGVPLIEGGGSTSAAGGGEGQEETKMGCGGGERGAEAEAGGASDEGGRAAEADHTCGPALAPESASASVSLSSAPDSVIVPESAASGLKGSGEGSPVCI
jgi:hypothetical protein